MTLVSGETVQGRTREARSEGEPGPGPHRRAEESARRWQRHLAAARRHLLERQRDDGHWRGELEGDSILQSEYILCLRFLGRGESERARKAAETLRRTQLDSGGWANYPGGPPDVSASAKAYFALKLAGDDPGAPHMRRARRTVRALGGLDACNSFTRIYLAIFGQYEWERCPAVPPELVLLPPRVPFSMYQMSSWTRAIVVPLSVIWASKPRCEVPGRAAVPELRVPGARPVDGLDKRGPWPRLFRFGDGLLRRIERAGLRPLRRRALRRAEAWILRRLEDSDGLAAIFPPIVNTLLAFRCLGYPEDHPMVEAQLAELERLVIEDGETVRVEPCFSPVWDTALALHALLAAGLPEDHPRALAAARWLIEREVRRPGDWQVRSPEVPVGGWYFEYANEFYPDCDDTSQVLTALARVRFPDPAEDRRRREAIGRGLDWLRAMQNRDGGWASFDRDCDKEFLTTIPFADHNAMIDPSTSDITARVLESLAVAAGERSSTRVARAVEFLLGRQEPDGSWYGRWGVNYIYGTWLALRGLEAAGTPAVEAKRRGADWLAGCQNRDGGWGELPLSYEDPAQRGRGPSTAAQTAWALLGLHAAGEGLSETVRRGLDHLAATQRDDGGWTDEPWTGTGFPRVFYLRYHYYSLYFPLLALATWLGPAAAAPWDDDGRAA